MTGELKDVLDHRIQDVLFSYKCHSSSPNSNFFVKQKIMEAWNKQ